MYGEDMDICDRIGNEGWEIVYTGAATITHYLGKSFEQQSEASVLQAIHKGPRAFFKKKNGSFAAFLFDLIMLVGFLTRWILFGLANLIRPGKGFGKMSTFSRRYVMITLRHLTHWS
jgi:GT2 family glycosyltransferase